MARSKPPVFVVGAPRSGTSLLYKALSLHPQAAYISNWVHRFPALPQLAALDRIARRLHGQRHRAWFPGGNAYAPTQSRQWWERLIPSPGEGEPVFARAGIGKKVATEVPPVSPEIRRLRAAFESIRRWDGGELLVVKRIDNNRRIPVLQAAFPEARFVELLRDGRAVALSLSQVDWWPHMRLWWLGQTPPEWVADGGDELELGIRHWAKETQTLQAGLTVAVEPERRMLVRYEDLVADPLPTLQNIARFAGLRADDPDWSKSLERMSFPNRNERWRSSLGAEAIARMEAAVGPTLVRYGYEPVDPSPRTGSE